MMKMKEILNTIKDLARSQGYYGRLYNNLRELQEEDPGEYERLAEEWEAEEFETTLDLVLYLEEGVSRKHKDESPTEDNGECETKAEETVYYMLEIIEPTNSGEFSLKKIFRSRDEMNMFLENYLKDNDLEMDDLEDMMNDWTARGPNWETLNDWVTEDEVEIRTSVIYNDMEV